MPRLPLALVLSLLWPIITFAEAPVMQLPVVDQSRWQYFSDQVMGGVSEGQARLETVEGAPALRLTGDVSTANRGGFIQARFDLDTPPPADAQGVVISVRGNGQRYFIHLRTRGTVLPWQYYQAGFDAGAQWQEVRLPFAAFERSGGLLRETPAPRTIRSLGLVAYGRDHEADVSLRAAGFY